MRLRSRGALGRHVPRVGLTPCLDPELPDGRIYDYAANKLGCDQPIDYFEFGVAHGESMPEVMNI